MPYFFHSGIVLNDGVAHRDLAVTVEGTKITAVGRQAERRAGSAGTQFNRVDLRGSYLAPGFVDLHTHGAVGVDFYLASADEIERAIREHYLPHGVTRLLVSLYPGPKREFLAAIRRVSRAIREGRGLGVAAGIHLEGPFLDPGHPGALPGKHFRKYSASLLNDLIDAGDGLVKTMTIAPERPGGEELIRHLKKRRVVPAFGHSGANFDDTERAVKLGVRYVTHLFNAMRGFHHRAPGPLPVLIGDPRVRVEIISDGLHVDERVLKDLAQRKAPEEICLVSDSAHPCGLRPGRYSFAGFPVILRGGRVTLADGTLAGSALTLDEAFRIQVQRVGVSPEKVSISASRAPARVVGWHRQLGEIKPGRRADLVILDRKFGVRQTFLGGEPVL